VGVGGVHCPSVLQEVEVCAQLNVVEVEPDHHDDGERGVESVVVVEVIVDERTEHVLVVVDIKC